jgi:predicted nuclease with TOPRIM domain
LLQSARHSAQPFVYGAIMETVREAWTDERMDDLVQHMDKSFDRVDARFEQVNARLEQVDLRFEKFESKMDARFDRIDDRFEKLEERITSRFDSLWRMMLAGYITAVFGLIAAQL